ncbi:protein MRP-126 [Anser cygnoides]|uniref:S100 calcium binding protein A12 n=1 Tax=Anser brachyrhynchus TaxID=132585 RepID=A0A8B9HY77_9AVES
MGGGQRRQTGYKRCLAPARPQVNPGRSRCFVNMSKGCQTQGPLSELEKSIDVIIDVFHQYSRREGDKDTLTRKELKLLIEKQLVNYLKHVKNQVSIDQIFKDLDTNKDEQLSFGEVMLLIIRVTVATHEHLHFCEDKLHHQQHQQQHQHQHNH